ncbi:hypothetical protein HK097_005668 [Rhizophlyctis rosea]|uniref:Uncharacterized protein n=1 Tax=Rhizophlyctis rosea TaxID=64517 RepID=A0AAD5S0F0_9FUNG|nr:hypothetical protein HK097_005668 [Rhizophlyctis rosea]
MKKRGNPDEVAYDDSLEIAPMKICMAEQRKLFDIMEIFTLINVDTLTLADLLWLSPYLRKKVMWGLRTLPKEKRKTLMKHFKYPEGYLEEPSNHLYGFRMVLEMSKWGILENMDGDLLLGRPFLEKTKAIADSATGRFFLQWHNRVMIADATGDKMPEVLKMEYDITYYLKNWDKFVMKREQQMLKEWYSGSTESEPMEETSEYDTGD